jgi:hypothetical protein
MYDRSSREKLEEKIGYEIWFLDLLSKTQETFEGGSDISTITLMNRRSGAQVAVTLTEVLSSGAAMKVLDAMIPLTFTASYKILDMIFEWILEENRLAGNVKRVPWRFSKKVELIKKKHNQLIYPPIFQSSPYIKSYLFALYSNLLEFRNEIVHKHNFSVSDSELRMDTNVEGEYYRLVLDRAELGALVRTVVAVANFLTCDLSFGPWEDRLLKYHLDRIQKLHGRDEFKQGKPILVNVVLKVPTQKGLFPADLRFVRQKITRIHPNKDVLFNLKIIGLVDGKPLIGWFFPADFVPKKDVFEIRLEDHAKYRVSLQEEQHETPT